MYEPSSNPRSLENEILPPDRAFELDTAEVQRDLGYARQVLDMMGHEGWTLFVSTFQHRLERQKDQLVSAHNALGIAQLQGEIKALQQLVGWEQEVRASEADARTKLDQMQQITLRRQEVWANG